MIEQPGNVDGQRERADLSEHGAGRRGAMVVGLMVEVERVARARRARRRGAAAAGCAFAVAAVAGWLSMPRGSAVAPPAPVPVANVDPPLEGEEIGAHVRVSSIVSTEAGAASRFTVRTADAGSRMVVMSGPGGVERIAGELELRAALASAGLPSGLIRIGGELRLASALPGEDGVERRPF